jgi:transcriptional regulator with GAF, ATPase, and Fis domain
VSVQSFFQSQLVPEQNELSNHDGLHAQRAFLVVRHGGRWSDVLRLGPDEPAIIGRSSSNSVAIRSHQASRRHAEIRWDEGKWWIRDLGSRNGTRVGGVPLVSTGGGQSARQLVDGDQIEIAGFSLLFVTRISDALAAGGASRFATAQGSPDNSGGTDQMTVDGIAGSEITHRLSESRYLDFSAADLSGPTLPTQRRADSTADLDVWQSLFRLAYRVASSDSIRDAAEITLQTLCGSIPDAFGGVFLIPKRDPDVGTTEAVAQAELIAFQSAANRSYSRPSVKMVESLEHGGRAILLRNLVDDGELQSADSRGDFSTQSAILAPIVIGKTRQSGVAPDKSLSVGFLHLYTVDSSAQWNVDHLELAAAAAGVFGAAVDSLTLRGRLMRSLRRSRRAVDSLRQRVDDSVRIVGTSPPIVRLKEVITRVAPTDTTVLIRGESGVGKELVAGAIHQASGRSDGPLICLNCAALSPTLLESELFGHEKGAFTGATEQKKGKFEAADGGTLMLDEIGEMDINLQAKLLRVLEGHPFERLGGHQPLRVDVRLVAATNRDLAAEVARGRFRADLYYRLNVVDIVVPPLRDRGADIAKLAEHFVSHFADKTARVIDGLTPAARQAIVAYAWPGNVRELKNVIERAVVLGNDTLIDVDDLALPAASIQSVDRNRPPSVESVPPQSEVVEVIDSRLSLSLEELERRHLLEVLRTTEGNKSRAAAILGIERSTLDRKLKRYKM